ncbi:MAG TPA: DUF4142 domain-containing protein [Conexibacter sp.]|jgi:putative membrane protein
MFRRPGRLAVLLAAVLVAGLVSAGSFAVARDKEDHHSDHGKGSGQRCDARCSGKHFSAWDEEWLMMSIQGDRFEIQGGNLAQQKGSSQAVRDLGAVLVKDHTESLADAVELAQRLGIDVPSGPSPSQQWELRTVASFSGRDFDRRYADLEVQDHVQDISEARDEAGKGCNKDVRHTAKDDIPVLQKHLELAQHALNGVI